MGKFVDLTNMSFGNWVVQKRGPNDLQKKPRWYCKCKCGNVHLVRGKSLKGKQSSACRKCMKTNKRHGLSLTPTYRIWTYMIARCHNPNDTAYKYYGARAITVCERWRKDFLNFLEDMGERPKNLSLDRINPSKGYFKENCRWVSRKIQDWNKSNTIKAGDVFQNWKVLERFSCHKKSKFECIFCHNTIIAGTYYVKHRGKECPRCQLHFSRYIPLRPT